MNEPFGLLIVKWTAGDFFFVLAIVITIGTVLGNIISRGINNLLRKLFSLPEEYRKGLSDTETKTESKVVNKEKQGRGGQKGLLYLIGNGLGWLLSKLNAFETEQEYWQQKEDDTDSEEEED